MLTAKITAAEPAHWKPRRDRRALRSTAKPAQLDLPLAVAADSSTSVNAPKSEDMLIELSDEESALLLRELNGIIDGDKYFLSPRIRMLKAIRSKIRPEPERPPLPPVKHYDRPRVGRGRRR
jgi:hypothetical protein